MSTLLALVLASASATDVVLDLGPEPFCIEDAGPSEPAWWNPGLDAAAKEARWQGASHASAYANGHKSQLRALFSPEHERIYVEVTVRGDPSVDPLDDAVLVGLSDDTGQLPELLIRFAALDDCAAPGACEGAGAELPESAVTFAAATPGPTSLTWSDLSAVNPSSTFEVEHPWVVLHDAGSYYIWTLSFELTVPVDGFGDIAPDLRMYTHAMAYQPGWTSGTYTELPLLCASSSSTTDDCLIGMGATTKLPGDLPTNVADTWPELQSSCD